MTRPKVKDFDYVSGKKYDGMMGRCYRETDPSFKNYGAKGVRVAGEWIRDINAFRSWARLQLHNQDISVLAFIESPGKYHLDRIDGNGHYSPANCRFLSPQENARNKPNVTRVVLSAEGEEIKI